VIASKVQSRVAAFTPATICFGVSVGPDGNFRISSRSLTMVFTLEPPMSIIKTFMPARSATFVP
jgi:hypothetical protein